MLIVVLVIERVKHRISDVGAYIYKNLPHTEYFKCQLTRPTILKPSLSHGKLGKIGACKLSECDRESGSLPKLIYRCVVLIIYNRAR